MHERVLWKAQGTWSVCMFSVRPGVAWTVSTMCVNTSHLGAIFAPLEAVPDLRTARSKL